MSSFFLLRTSIFIVWLLIYIDCSIEDKSSVDSSILSVGSVVSKDILIGTTEMYTSPLDLHFTFSVTYIFFEWSSQVLVLPSTTFWWYHCVRHLHDSVSLFLSFLTVQWTVFWRHSHMTWYGHIGHWKHRYHS